MTTWRIGNKLCSAISNVFISFYISYDFGSTLPGILDPPLVVGRGGGGGGGGGGGEGGGRGWGGGWHHWHCTCPKPTSVGCVARGCILHNVVENQQIEATYFCLLFDSQRHQLPSSPATIHTATESAVMFKVHTFFFFKLRVSMQSSAIRWGFGPITDTDVCE